MVTLQQARDKVIATVAALRREVPLESIGLREAAGRVLAEPVIADRDYPPFNRSTRDGFAVRSQDVRDLGAILRRIGEIKAGGSFAGSVGPEECVQIMTGAALPAGSDSVVMIEYAQLDGDRVTLDRAALPGQNMVPRGAEAKAGAVLLARGTRLGYSEIALTAQVGRDPVRVYRRPRIAILSTGDEVVDVKDTPGPLQIRNGNSLALETQVRSAGGEPDSLGNAPDEKGELRRRIERGLQADALVLSGGVSMGKYDLVEAVLAELGAEILFDAVAIRPGKPAVFGLCRGKPVFGLPGNPLSTMVTFELFVAPAVDILGGAQPQPLAILGARLAHSLHENRAVTHVLPARLAQTASDPEISAVPWQGSGDTVALARANAFLFVTPEDAELQAGDWAKVLVPRTGGGTK